MCHTIRRHCYLIVLDDQNLNLNQNLIVDNNQIKHDVVLIMCNLYEDISLYDTKIYSTKHMIGVCALGHRIVCLRNMIYLSYHTTDNTVINLIISKIEIIMNHTIIYDDVTSF